MKEKGIAILVVLAFIGMGMAFLFVGLMVSGTRTSHEDVWMYQNPVKEEFTSFPTLTEDQRQAAIEIAKQNETVKQYLDQGYEIGSRSFIFTNIPKHEAEIADVYVTLTKDKDWVFANVDLNEEKVTGILKSRGEIAGLEMREGGEIKAVNETEIRIAIGGREGKLIRAPEVRELTEEEREKAREIALSDTEVQNIIEGKNYKMTEIKSTGVIITNEVGEVETKFDGASIMFELEDGTVYFVHVDLEKGKVIRISPPLLPPPMPPINK
ncbi:MAG: hypothetical protein KAU16_03470 [Methanophagales archaeon]|nr:hypothetical protein [Methanophagales archaeon]